MNIPANFLSKLIEEIDITPILLLGTENYLDNSALKAIVDKEDIRTVLKLLKVKLILISKNKCDASDFDLTDLLEKLSENADLYTVHDVLLYALLIQQSCDVLNNLLDTTYSTLSDTSEKDKQIIHFNLEIVDVIIEICTLTQNDTLKAYFVAKNINKLLMNFISNQEKEVRMKIVKDLIPKYMKCTENYDILAALWNESKDDSFFYDYILFVLEEYFMPKCKNKVKFSILDQPAYWTKLQTNFTSDNPFVKKQTVYFLRKSVQILLRNERYIETAPDIMKWNRMQTQECENAWRNFFILCDTSNEKQLHLIEPTFKLYSTLHVLHSTWQRCITVLYISHPHSAVIRHAVSQVLSQKWACDVDTLLTGLNNSFLFDSLQDCPIMADLNAYISHLPLEDFEKFAQLLATRPPSPVPFYYLCKSLESFNKSGLNLKIIIDLIHSSANVPHLYIRKAIQNSLFALATKLELTDGHFQDEPTFRDLIKMIFLFHNVGYLQRSNASWNKTRDWLSAKKDLCENSFANVFRDMEQGNFQFTPQHYAMWLVLLADMANKSSCDYTNIITRIETSKDYAQKLVYMLIICHVLRMSASENTNKPYSTNFVPLFIRELFFICIEMKDHGCRTELCNNIVFIIEVVYCSADIRRDFRDLLLDFLHTLQVHLVYDCYTVLSRKILQIYGQSEMNTGDSDCVLRTVAASLEQVKETSTDSRQAREISSSYYCAKVWLARTQLTSRTALCLQELSECYDNVGTGILVAVLDALLALLDRSTTDDWLAHELTEYCTLLRTLQADIFLIRTQHVFRACFKRLVRIVTHRHFVSSAMMCPVRDHLCTEVFASVQSGTGSRNMLLKQAVVGKQLMISVETLVEALLYGPVLRKDQRIEFDTCAAISREAFMQGLDKDLINPCELDGKVRSQAVDVLLKVMEHPGDGGRIVPVVLRLLQLKYGEFANKRYFGDSQIHLLKLRIMQTLHVMADSLSVDDSHTLTHWLVECLVSESQQFSVKLLIQWLLVRLYRTVNTVTGTLTKLLALLKDLQGGSKCTALFPVLYHVLRARDVALSVVHDCMNALLPYTMGQHFTIRHYAQVTIKHIYQHYESNNEFKTHYSPVYSTVCDVINRTTSERISDIVLNFTHLPQSLDTIYFHIPRLTNVTHTEWLPIDYFHTLYKRKCTKILAKTVIPLQTRSSDVLPPCDSSCIDGSTNVQKKMGTFSAMNVASDQCDVTTVKTNLIVVASLVDRPPNLGGLSRTCEVFGVGRYVLNNAQLVKNKEYQSLSMSSEKWVDTVEVKAENLPQYLMDMKGKGYRIVGAEQTADSRRLDSYQFERNTVLVLGNEKEGISANLIHLLDHCLEIPQFGQVRSLNVHVAGALFIWEYAKQHCTNT